MRVQRFDARVAAGPRGRGVIAVPFDPDEVWGAKAEHPAGGTINGRHVRGTIAPDGSGWAFTLSPMWMRGAEVAAGDDVMVELGPEGPQRGDLADDIAAALEASPAAAAFFDTLAQFYRKAYLRWIDATNRHGSPSPGPAGRRTEAMDWPVRLIPDRSATPAGRLGREPGDEVESPLYPAGERLIGRVACRFDADEAGHDPAAEQHRPYVRLAEGLLAAVGTDPDHQRRPGDAAAHIAVDRKRQATDHLLLRNVVAAGQQPPHARGSLGVEAQASRASSRHRPASSERRVPQPVGQQGLLAEDLHAGI
jgi:hypothetical protein